MRSVRNIQFCIKHYYCIAFIFFFAAILNAQQFKGGAFGAPEIKITKLVDQSALLVGGRLGWIINKHFVLGGGFYSLVSNINTGMTDVEGKSYYLGFSYGGLELEYVFLPDNKFNFSADMLFAGGGVSYSVKNKNAEDSYDLTQDLLVWEPSLNFELKTLSWMHVDFGLSYRFISQFDKFYNTSKSDLQGFNFLLILKFGEY
jgi:hypothetical protein